MFIRLIFCLAISVCLANTAVAQNFEINNETITTCAGSFQDDNGGVGDVDGTEGSPYSSEPYTFTICPDSPGDVIQVDFVAFNLYTSPNPNNSDYLAIYDGDDASANSMGSYTGNQLSGIPVTGTVNNESGCLTFVFQPSASSTGTFAGWEALISCTTPCDPPTGLGSIVDPEPDLENSVSVCLDTPISFVDAGSFAAPGFTIENYIWDFDDGTVVEGQQDVVHSFSEPGEYIVTLTVVDNNGCQNLNLVPLQVLVSTIPIFDTDFTPEICLGGTGFVDGSPVQSQTWTALPPQVVAGETYLADGAGFSYTSSLVFDFFEEDQVLTDCADLNGISVNMEHSYMGDLDIIITCPDGTSLFLFEQAGGGTFLGEAVDDGSTTPGVGYDYVWSPTATNGTWGENAGGVAILPAGTYESNEDMCQLEGCPLNGEWTIEVIDNLAIDNGYIFEWGIDLNPDLFPGITTFTPEIGLGLDSTWVEGDFMDILSDDGNYAEITPPALGDYEYTFFAANNFGCTFDTTLVVSVVPGPVVDAGLDLQICNDPLDMEAVITSNEFEAEPCTFLFVLSNNDFGFNNSAVEISFDGVFQETIQSTGIEQEFEVAVPSGLEMTLEYVYSTWGEADGNQVTVYDDTGTLIFESEVSPDQGVIFQETVTCLGDGQLQYEWSPQEGLSNPFIPNPIVDVSQTTEYTISVYPQGFEGCVTEDEVIVAVDPAGDPGTDSVLVLCFNFGEFNLIDMLGGTPVNTGAWTDGANNPVDGIFNTFTDAGDVFTYTVVNQGCTNSAQVSIDVIPQGDPICCEFEYTTTTTDALCQGSSDGSITINMISSTEGGPWVIDLTDGVISESITTNDLAQFQDLPAGNYDVIITDAGLCITNIVIEVVEPGPVLFETVADSTICLTGVATLDAWSVQDVNDLFVYSWDGLGDGVQTVSPDVQTVYNVVATNENNCLSEPQSVTINLYDPLSIEVTPDLYVCQDIESILEVTNTEGGFGGYNYDWQLNGNSIGFLDTQSVSPSEDVEVCITLTDGCETPSITSCILVDVEPTPPISLYSSLTSGCEPLNVTFENLTDPDLYESTLWNVGDASYTGNDPIEHVYEEAGIFDIVLSVESAIGCSYSLTFDNYMTVYDSPEPHFIWEPVPTTIPDTDIDFNNLTEGFIAEHSWVFDTLNVLGTSSEVHPSFSFPISQGGIYPTSLTVTDLNGCTTTQVYDVVINDPLNVFIPTAFTPNNDGTNDLLFVKGTDIDPDKYHIQIFNRWGLMVFESRDIEEGWNGSYLNGDYYVDGDVYNYRVVTYRASTTERVEIRGHVTVAR